MTDPMKQAWGDVAEGFGSLGRTVQERYAASTDSATEAATEAADETQAAMREALDRVIAAAKDFGDRAGDVARDEAVRDQAKHAVGTLADALSATAELIGHQVTTWFSGSATGSAATDEESGDHERAVSTDPE